MRRRVAWEQPHPDRHALTEVDLDLDRSALVLMDFQAAFVQPDVGLGPRLAAASPRTHAAYYGRLQRTVLPNATRLLARFRSLGLPVVFTRLGQGPTGTAPLAPWSWRGALQRRGGGLVQLTDPVAAVIPTLAPRPGELVVDRPTFSAFHASVLDQCLRNMGVQNLVIAGVQTEAAPETTARGAGERGYWTVLVEDACATTDPREHAETFADLAWCVGRTTDAVLALFASDAPERTAGPDPTAPAGAALDGPG